MTWFKGDDKAHASAKLKFAKLEGTGLHFLAVSWCADYETDGVLPKHVVPTLAPEVSKKALAAIVARLTATAPGSKQPCWHVEGDLYRINDYLTYNPSHAELEGKREVEKKRIEKRRAEKALERLTQQALEAS